MVTEYTNLIDYVMISHKDHTDYKKEILRPLVEDAFKSQISKYSGIDSLTGVMVSVTSGVYNEFKHKASEATLNKLIDKVTNEILEKRKIQLKQQKELEALRKKHNK